MQMWKQEAIWGKRQTPEKLRLKTKRHFVSKTATVCRIYYIFFFIKFNCKCLNRPQFVENFKEEFFWRNVARSWWNCTVSNTQRPTPRCKGSIGLVFKEPFKWFWYDKWNKKFCSVALKPHCVTYWSTKQKNKNRASNSSDMVLCHKIG